MTAKQLDRRTFLATTGIAGAGVLAGCTGGSDASGGGGGGGGSSGSGDGSSGGSRQYLDEEPDYGGWLEDATNYEGTVDATGQGEVTVAVGYDQYAFDPPAIAVSTGTTVTWEWTGEGGSHNVVSRDDGPLESELTDEEGHTYSHTFEEAGTFPYFCRPHKAMGMKGAVHVE